MQHEGALGKVAIRC